jgi:hypothetical protein
MDFSTCLFCDHPTVVHRPVMALHPALTFDDIARMNSVIRKTVIDSSTFIKCSHPDCFCRFVDNGKELIFYV